MSGPGRLAELEARARSGDAQAQYVLAAYLSTQGRKAEGRDWLARSAAAGFADAIFTQATILMNGVDGTRDIAHGLTLLRDAVGKGSLGAKRLLALTTALGVGGASDWPQAAHMLIETALAGDPAALRELAFLIEMAAPGDARAAACLLRAARGGDGLAGFALIARAAQGKPSATAAELTRWLERLHRAGHPLAYRYKGTPIAAEADATVALDPASIAQLLASPPGLDRIVRTPLSERPTAVSFDRLMAAEECDYVVAIARRVLQPSTVTHPVTGVALRHPDRTSSTASLAPLDQDLVIHALNLRLAAAAGLPVENGEMLSVLKYEPGQEYTPHFDFLGDRNEPAAQFETAGQRVRTLLVYLSADYDGGETHFLTNGLKFKGKVGDGLLFHNVDGEGKRDMTSRHAGLPVVSGTKWLASKWFRERTYPL